MNRKKPANPLQTALLILAIIVAVGFAYWNINRAMSPPSPPAPTASNQPPARAPSVATAPSPTGGGAAGQKPDVSVSARSGPGSEAHMAPGANPFIPLPPTVPGASQPPAYIAPPVSAPPSTVSAPPGPAAPGPTGLPPLSPGQVRPLLSSGLSAPRPLLEPEPQLVGTLLGEQPSAVFRADKQLAIVPVGESFGPWKVVAVNHGGAVVRSARRTIRLAVGETHASSGLVMRAEEPSQAPIMAESAPAPADTAVNPAWSRAADGIRAAEPETPSGAPPTPEGSSGAPAQDEGQAASGTGGGEPIRLAALTSANYHVKLPATAAPSDARQPTGPAVQVPVNRAPATPVRTNTTAPARSVPVTTGTVRHAASATTGVRRRAHRRSLRRRARRHLHEVVSPARYRHSVRSYRPIRKGHRLRRHRHYIRSGRSHFRHISFRRLGS